MPLCYRRSPTIRLTDPSAEAFPSFALWLLPYLTGTGGTRGGERFPMSRRVVVQRCTQKDRTMMTRSHLINGGKLHPYPASTGLRSVCAGLIRRWLAERHVEGTT